MPTFKNNADKIRIDLFLVNKFPTLSRSFIQKLIQDRLVTVNKVVPKANLKLKLNDKVVVNFDVDSLKNVPEIDLPIVYEDDDCLVINKPEGLLTHSKGSFSPEPTVASFIANKQTKNDSNRAGIVHRLDRDTSGVIICAKSPESLLYLQRQFSKRTVKKTYLALITGFPGHEKATIDMPIMRNPKAPSTFRVHPNGKNAITDYEVVEKSKHFTLVKLTPKTGRTHQLRVHLAKIGHPIVGDKLYGGEQADRLYLHAYSLDITTPNGVKNYFQIDLPNRFMEKLKNDI